MKGFTIPNYYSIVFFLSLKRYTDLVLLQERNFCNYVLLFFLLMYYYIPRELFAIKISKKIAISMKSSVNLFDFTKLNLTPNYCNEFEIKAHYSLVEVLR